MADQPGSASVEAAISDALTKLHVRYYGMGPRRAETYMQDCFVFCVLSGPFTTAERTLIDSGYRLQVRNVRQVFQDAMITQFSGVIEELTGRKVTAFMSQTHIGPDMAIEIFKLEEPGLDLL